MLYEYFFIDNSIYYINFQQNNKNIIYFIEDYFGKIKLNGFYGSFMEIYSLSKIYKKSINVLVLKYNYKNTIYCSIDIGISYLLKEIFL